jgi:hypothetical protein
MAKKNGLGSPKPSWEKTSFYLNRIEYPICAETAANVFGGLGLEQRPGFVQSEPHADQERYPDSKPGQDPAKTEAAARRVLGSNSVMIRLLG